jgi:hypothetical protein
MPLTRGQIVGYDGERLAFKFTMLNADQTINCQISDAAMNELVGTQGSLYTVRQAQFLAHRETIESIASNLFDAASAVPGSVVRIPVTPNGWLSFTEREKEYCDRAVLKMAGDGSGQANDLRHDPIRYWTEAELLHFIFGVET